MMAVRRKLGIAGQRRKARRTLHETTTCAQGKDLASFLKFQPDCQHFLTLAGIWMSLRHLDAQQEVVQSNADFPSACFLIEIVGGRRAVYSNMSLKNTEIIPGLLRMRVRPLDLIGRFTPCGDHGLDDLVILVVQAVPVLQPK